MGNRLDKQYSCYDGNGNRLTESALGYTRSYDYQANRLVETVMGQNEGPRRCGGDALSLQYDEAGNTVGDGQFDFTFNQNNQTASVLQRGRVLALYTYNGLGQRVVKELAGKGDCDGHGARILFHYDQKGRLIEESDAEGNPIRDYVYLGGVPLAVIQEEGWQEEPFFYHNDRLGTPKALTDMHREVARRAEYDPFGNPVGGRAGIRVGVETAGAGWAPSPAVLTG